MTPGTAGLLAVAGFVGGAINAAAGGGSLVTFPALLHAGLTPLSANVTNTVGLVPGYLGGVLGHQRRNESLPEVGQRPLALTAVAGAGVGVVLLLTTPEKLFSNVAPYLVLLAVVLLLAQKRILGALRSRGHTGGRRWVLAATFVAAVYGAYFGAAMGVLLLALLSISSRAEFPLANAVKTLLSFIVNVLAALAYAVFAPVAWWQALVVAVASLAGGYLGGTVARRIPVLVLRLATAALGLVAFVTLIR
ncbi:MAG: uncharacterized protein QOC60_1801 [Frankiaceae bacterium]|jgi:uncharacterized membrane protein YfcA|nr:uncharacterized protein [Frankiaceae bacterium]MDQ1715856.1 uncharacterized protein [Frankiaceae bacterium]